MSFAEQAQGRHEIFIYYRCARLDAQALQAAVERMQGALRSLHPGLHARLLQRRSPREEHDTWMEAYELAAHADADRVLASIEASAAQALGLWLKSERHSEHFTACAS